MLNSVPQSSVIYSTDNYVLQPNYHFAHIPLEENILEELNRRGGGFAPQFYSVRQTENISTDTKAGESGAQHEILEARKSLELFVFLQNKYMYYNFSR